MADQDVRGVYEVRYISRAFCTSLYDTFEEQGAYQ